MVAGVAVTITIRSSGVMAVVAHRSRGVDVRRNEAGGIREPRILVLARLILAGLILARSVAIVYGSTIHGRASVTIVSWSSQGGIGAVLGAVGVGSDVRNLVERSTRSSVGSRNSAGSRGSISSHGIGIEDPRDERRTHASFDRTAHGGVAVEKGTRHFSGPNVRINTAARSLGWTWSLRLLELHTKTVAMKIDLQISQLLAARGETLGLTGS